MYIFMYMCIHLCFYVHNQIYIYMYVPVYIYVYISITYTYTCVCIYPYIYLYTNIFVPMYEYLFIDLNGIRSSHQNRKYHCFVPSPK